MTRPAPTPVPVPTCQYVEPSYTATGVVTSTIDTVCTTTPTSWLPWLPCGMAGPSVSTRGGVPFSLTTVPTLVGLSDGPHMSSRVVSCPGTGLHPDVSRDEPECASHAVSFMCPGNPTEPGVRCTVVSESHPGPRGVCSEALTVGAPFHCYQSNAESVRTDPRPLVSLPTISTPAGAHGTAGQRSITSTTPVVVTCTALTSGAHPLVLPLLFPH